MDRQVVEEVVNEAQQAWSTIEQLDRRVLQEETALHNFRLHASELVGHLLRNGFNVSGASGTPPSEGVPRPFFTVERTTSGRPGRYTVPVVEPPSSATEDRQMDRDVDMVEPPTRVRTFQQDSQMRLRRVKADIFDGLDSESDEPDVTSSEEEVDSGDSQKEVSVTKNKRTGKGKNKSKDQGKGKKPQTRNVEDEGMNAANTSVYDVSGNVIPESPPVHRSSQWTSGVFTRLANSLSATRRHQWSDSDPRDSDIGPVPQWGAQARRMAGPSHAMGTGRSTSENLGGGRPEPGNKDPPRKGGTELGSSTPTVNATSTGPPANLGPPGIFNGIPWTARRLPAPSFPPGMTAEDKQKLVESSGANARRPPLKRGEIPPRFLEANVTNVGTLQNLIDRVVDERNSGAWESLEILGDLKNASNRAPKPRHALERYILKNFANRPGWIGSKRIKKADLPVNYGRPQMSTGQETTGPANTFVVGSSSQSTTATRTIVEDVPMAPPLNEGVNHHGPTLSRPSPGVGGTDDNVTEPQGTGPSEAGIPLPLSPPGHDGVTAAILAGFNLQDQAEAHRLYLILNSPDSPLNRPQSDEWASFTAGRPGISLFHLPIGQPTDTSRRLSQGLLSVIRRAPSPRTVRGVFLILRALQNNWTGDRNFIATACNTPVEMSVDDITHEDRVIQHFSRTGVNPEELEDLMYMLEFLRTFPY